VSSLPSARYLETRLSIMGSALLPDSTFAELVEKPLDQGVLAVLGLAGASVPERLSDTALENLLSHHLLQDLSVILRPLTGPARDFFTYWARRFELFNLKTLIHGKQRGLPSSEIERHLEPTPSFAELPHERLLDTEDAAELLRQIEAGPYGPIARQARRAMEEDQDTLAAETAIDKRYFRGLVAQARQLPEPDRQTVARLLGCQLDRLNLGWLLRYRFGHGMSPSESYYPLMRGGEQLGHEALLKLVELKDLQAVLAALPPGLAERLHGASDSFTVELRLEALLHERARDAFRQTNPSTTARALAYLMLRDGQLRRLRAILQGKRLGLPKPLIARAAGLELA
jgi:V/A-type H+-transporting ATPase subunit C